MKTTLIIVIIIALLLVGAAGVGGYFYGLRVGQTRLQTTYQSFIRERTGGQPGAGGFFAAPGTGQVQGVLRGGVAGEVESVQGKTIRVTTAEGTVEILVNEDTILRKTTTFALEELKPGEQVMVIGDRDSTGKIVARSVQVGFFAQPGRPTP